MKHNKNWLHQEIGKYFRKARIDARVSQKVAGKHIKSGAQYISNMERGLCSLNHEAMRKLIKSYQLSETRAVEDLIDLQHKYLAAELKGKSLWKKS